MCHRPLVQIIRNDAAIFSGLCVCVARAVCTSVPCTTGSQSIEMHSFVPYHNANSRVDTGREEK